MQFWIVNSLIIFVISVIFTGVLIPKILLIAFRKNLFDKPDERKIYVGSTPRLGGLAFFPVIAFSLALTLGVNFVFGNEFILSVFEGNLLSLIFSLCSLTILYLVGIADDLIGVRYTAKFFVQIVAAILLISSGLYIDNLYGILGLFSLPLWVAYIFTIFVVVFIVNALNLIDGIDGLASGLSAMACLFYAIIFFLLGEYFYVFVAVATLGTIVPFFYYNVFGDVKKQKKIYMGDTGSLTIGLILSVLFIKLFTISDFSFVNDINVVVLAFSPLLIPCFDVVRVVIHRLKNKKNPFLADRNHIHHKLLDVGFSARKAMMLIVFGALFCVGFNILLSLNLNVNIVFAIDIVLYTLFNIWLTSRINNYKK